MNNLRQTDQQKIQSRNTVIIKNLFNINFRMDTYYRGASNIQYFFSDYKNTILFGYLQFVLNGKRKMLKKYMMPGERISMLSKSEEFFLIYPQKLELWQFGCFQNCEVYQQIYETDNPILYIYQIGEIGISQGENILVFQMLKEIFIFSKNLKGFWTLEQTIISHYKNLRHIRFNQSDDIIVAYSSSNSVFATGQLYLMIFYKNQNGIWQNAHSVQESYYEYNPFCFMNDHQFILFHLDKISWVIYEISKTDQKAYVKAKLGCEYMKFKYYQGLIEIQSKKLILLNYQYFFHIKETNPFKLSQQLHNCFQVDKVKNSEYLICRQLRKTQVFNIYLE